MEFLRHVIFIIQKQTTSTTTAAAAAAELMLLLLLLLLLLICFGINEIKVTINAVLLILRCKVWIIIHEGVGTVVAGVCGVIMTSVSIFDYKQFRT